jgi:hypothetical protein
MCCIVTRACKLCHFKVGGTSGSVIPQTSSKRAAKNENRCALQVWMDTRYKGFQLVTLTQELHHVDFITVQSTPVPLACHCQSCSFCITRFREC